MAREGIGIDLLEPGTTVVVNTRNSCYRFVVLHDPEFVLVNGGTMFPNPTAVRFDGATFGRGVVKPGWILVGLSMRMSVGIKRITSSRVRSVAIETMPVMGARRHMSIH